MTSDLCYLRDFSSFKTRKRDDKATVSRRTEGHQHHFFGGINKVFFGIRIQASPQILKHEHNPRPLK